MAAAQSPRLPFRRAQRLKQNRDFARVRSTGQRLVNGCLIANWSALPPGATARLGVVTSGKLGNAVVRSRARRLLRECFRLHQHELAQPVELVLVARASIVGRGLAEVEKDFLTVARKASLLKT
jgi:ribonuclease P protein component